MQSTGSGGIGAVSSGIPEVLLGLMILVVVVFVLWKLASYLMSM